jgi:hypothetical protein
LHSIILVDLIKYDDISGAVAHMGGDEKCIILAAESQENMPLMRPRRSDIKMDLGKIGYEIVG